VKTIEEPPARNATPTAVPSAASPSTSAALPPAASVADADRFDPEAVPGLAEEARLVVPDGAAGREREDGRGMTSNGLA